MQLSEIRAVLFRTVCPLTSQVGTNWVAFVVLSPLWFFTTGFSNTVCHRQSLAIHWLGLGAFTAGGQVQSLVGELRTRKPYSMAKGGKKPTLYARSFRSQKYPSSSSSSSFFKKNIVLLLWFPFGNGFPGGSGSACNAGDLGSIPGLGRFPWRREWQPTPAFFPGESSWTKEPWGQKETWLST